jgi:hypothetical protein
MLRLEGRSVGAVAGDKVSKIIARPLEGPWRVPKPGKAHGMTALDGGWIVVQASG